MTYDLVCVGRRCLAASVVRDKLFSFCCSLSVFCLSILNLASWPGVLDLRIRGANMFDLLAYYYYYYYYCTHYRWMMEWVVAARRRGAGNVR